MTIGVYYDTIRKDFWDNVKRGDDNTRDVEIEDKFLEQWAAKHGMSMDYVMNESICDDFDGLIEDADRSGAWLDKEKNAKDIAETW